MGRGVGDPEAGVGGGVFVRGALAEGGFADGIDIVVDGLVGADSGLEVVEGGLELVITHMNGEGPSETSVSGGAIDGVLGVVVLERSGEASHPEERRDGVAVGGAEAGLEARSLNSALLSLLAELGGELGVSAEQGCGRRARSCRAAVRGLRGVDRWHWNIEDGVERLADGCWHWRRQWRARRERRVDKQRQGGRQRGLVLFVGRAGWRHCWLGQMLGVYIGIWEWIT